ncbi:flagellar hook-associated protein 2 [Metasolibacillus fluoroglycofenilyticus]|uniref:flagellar hook-associated protein 2 n=1 Tax=Metasolibacillus fluoroglycofenilyticus TaxID=1239396 RepID=UPI000D368523|nr:flagellar hook-associated protein 2 [Metasolibacillus fluoroglycofenilyticus]
MVMRIGGLASGMDIDSIVEKLMQAEKAPLNKLYQNKQKYEWQRDAYRDVNKQLKAFDDYIQKNMMYKKDFAKKVVISSNSAVSATPTSAQNGQTLNIDHIEKIARAGNTTGGDGIIAAGTEGTKKLSEIGGITPGTVEMSVLQTDGTYKDVTLTFSENDSINDVISKIKNGDDGKGTGLNAFYDKASGKISISTQATGAGENYKEARWDQASSEYTFADTSASVVIKSDANNFFDSLGFGTKELRDPADKEGPSVGKSLITNGENAKLTVNGMEIERQSNTFELDGFTITLNNTFNGAGSQPISLTAKTDTDNMVDKIKEFVETYNSLIDSLNSQIKEKKYRDFLPLTEEQKKDMKEKEIEAWEEKAKSGLLRGDSIIQSVLSNMRTDMYSKGAASNEEFNALFKIGITTSSKTSENGKLEIDEDKLRAAIEKDPDAVYSLFSGTVENPGIADRLQKSIKTATINIEKKAGKADSVNNTFNLGLTLNDVETRIEAWKTKLANIEQRYWKQFTAMETAINKANQQSSMFFAGQTQ